MKNKFLKQAYVSIEVIIVAAVILTAGLSGVLAFVKNGKNNNKTMLNAIDDVYTELEMPLGGGTGGTGNGGSGGTGDIIVPEIPLVGEAYAIYTDADKTLRFIRSETVPVAGDIYEGLEITNVYSDIETTYYDSNIEDSGFGDIDDVPWVVDHKNDIEKILFVDEIRPISTAYWFAKIKYCSYLDLDKLNTSKVTNMNGMFYYISNNSAITTLSINLSNWDVSSVTNMRNMFSNACSYATSWSVGDLTNWDVSNVTNMSSMFSLAGYRESSSWSVGDLTNWDVSNVTDMGSMFYGAGQNATSWSIGDLSNWEVSNVTNMGHMFGSAGYNATSWTVGYLNNWNVSNVTDMKHMFIGAGYKSNAFALDLTNWDVSNVTDMSYMFSTAGKESSSWSIGDLSNWDVSNVTNMNYMFDRAGQSASYTLDLRAWKDKVRSDVTKTRFEYNVTSKIITPWE